MLPAETDTEPSRLLQRRQRLVHRRPRPRLLVRCLVIRHQRHLPRLDRCSVRPEGFVERVALLVLASRLCQVSVRLASGGRVGV